MIYSGDIMEKNENIVKLSKAINPTVYDFKAKFDDAMDLKDMEATKSLIKESLDFIKNNSSIDELSKADLFYSIATSYSNLDMFSKEYSTEENKAKSIYYFRKSIEIIDSIDISTLNNIEHFNVLRHSLFTNYGILHSRIGRPILAIKYFLTTINIFPNFDMAIGNLGVTYFSYGITQLNDFHKHSINYMAYRLLEDASSVDSNTDESAKQYFIEIKNKFNKHYVHDYLLKYYPYKEFGNSEFNNTESTYREEILYMRLFLSPLNDLLFIENHMAKDDIKISDEISSKYLHMFDSIKQEFISARYNYFNYHQNNYPIYIDKDTYINDSNGIYIHSLRIESLKLSYRSLYSIFDKVAYFLNDYFNIGIKERDVNFNSLWKSEKNGKNGYKYKNVIPFKDNLYLNGIRWIYKDLYIKGFNSPNPHAEHLKTLRHSLEHKFVKIYNDNEIKFSSNNKKLEFSTKYLEASTLELLELSRELIMYLAMAINLDKEKQKRKD